MVDITTLDEAGFEDAQIYYALLGRFDTALIEYWDALGAHGPSQFSIAQSILQSPEYKQEHRHPSDARFVNALYEAALGHPADAGAGQRIHSLHNGTSRAAVAVGIATSAEAAGHLEPKILSAFSFHI